MGQKKINSIINLTMIVNGFYCDCSLTSNSVMFCIRMDCDEKFSFKIQLDW